MASLQEILIESMIKDLAEIEKIDINKNKRKECSLLLKRIESAKKLCAVNIELTAKLLVIENKAQNLKEKAK